jgi:crotonobetainyl-CoA:carnitine CoA-transferase CaiB-like acyl-CoA transferase
VLSDARSPAAPVNTLPEAVDEPQTAARAMKVAVPLPDGSTLDQPGNPVKLSLSAPATFRAPPRVGEHTAAVLGSLLQVSEAELAQWQAEGVVGL